MTVSTLDPMTALIVIDLQTGITALAVAHPITEVVKLSRALADAFRSHGLPVVLVNVDGGAPGRTERPRRSEAVSRRMDGPHSRTQPTTITTIVITKQTWGAFASTNLEEQLKALGVTQVVLCGVATSAGVESTARQAYEQGFNVTLAIDAMTDMSADAHQTASPAFSRSWEKPARRKKSSIF